MSKAVFTSIYLTDRTFRLALPGHLRILSVLKVEFPTSGSGGLFRSLPKFRYVYNKIAIFFAKKKTYRLVGPTFHYISNGHWGVGIGHCSFRMILQLLETRPIIPTWYHQDRTNSKNRLLAVIR